MICSIIIDDVFSVIPSDSETKKFDKIDRIKAKAENFSCNIEADINCELLKLHPESRINICLIKVTGPELERYSSLSESEEFKKISGNYNYLTFGKIIKIDNSKTKISSLVISCGGLLLRAEMESSMLHGLYIGTNIFFCIKPLK